MTQKTTYICNLCDEGSDPEDLTGLRFGANGGLEVGRAADVHRHICQNCIDFVNSIKQSEPARQITR